MKIIVNGSIMVVFFVFVKAMEEKIGRGWGRLEDGRWKESPNSTFAYTTIDLLQPYDYLTCLFSH